MTFVETDVGAAVDAVPTATPLVAAVTNDVTVGDVANVVRFWGGLPVMSNDVREIEDMVAAADGCLLNMGTVDEAQEELLVAAGRAANEVGAPVVFDPVGVGATPTRDRVAARIVEAVDVDVIKGNHGEVSALAGAEAEVRGVESVGEYGDIVESAVALARQTDAVVVASGATDVVATDALAATCSVGHERMGSFVGTGCTLGGALAAFAGATEPIAESALAGTVAFGLAGERAAAVDGGPASYRTAFYDAMAALDGDTVDDAAPRDRLTVHRPA